MRQLSIGMGIGLTSGWGVGDPIAALGADLALWFDTNQAYKSSGGGVVTPASILTVVRASAGSYFDAAGVLQQAGNNTLRLDYDPVTLAAKGVLLEEQRTNLALQSQSVVGWSPIGLLDNAAATAGALDGTATFQNLTPNTSSAQHYTSTASITTAAVTVCVSAFFKSDGYRWVRFARGSGGGIISIDTLAGTIGSTSGILASGVIPCGNGVFRFWFTYAATVIAASAFISVNISDSTNAQTYAGDGVSRVLVWGTQLEAGTFPTSYIPTVASQVTRAADRLSIPTSAFPYNAAASTLVIDASYTSVVSYYEYYVNLSDGTVTNTMSFTVNGGTAAIRLRSGGVDFMDHYRPSPLLVGTVTKIALTASLNDGAVSYNGAAVISDATVTMPINVSVLSMAYFGSGHIKRLEYYGSRKTNAQLQALST